MNMESQEISEFGIILIFIVVGILFVNLVLFVGKLIRPHRPNPEKNATYESGEEAVGNAWAMFNPRFYIIALIFLLFEVELVFMFPWATVFGNKELIDATGGSWGWIAVVEMFFFVGILALGLAYVWKKGYLNWQQATAPILTTAPDFKRHMYETINKKYGK